MIDQKLSLRAASLALLISLASASPLFAQLPGLGVKGGVNLATQKTSGDNAGDDGLTSSPGLVAGVFMTFPLGWIEFQPEALYSVKGAKVDESAFTSKVLIDYLEVPMLARVSRRGGGRLGFYVAGGPYAAFRLRARTRTQFGGATEEIDISEQVERIDFGVTAGGGVEWGPWVFDGRYSHGLKDIDKETGDGIKLTNRAVTITAGFRF